VPSKSTQLDFNRPHRAATPQTATGKVGDGVVGLADSAADAPTSNSQPNGDGSMASKISPTMRS
jgi:hypothetical protein